MAEAGPDQQPKVGEHNGDTGPRSESHIRDEVRFPRRLYRDGEEPDPRFSLANERTFLAWIRTALALLALSGGLLALNFQGRDHWRSAGAAFFATAASLVGLWAWVNLLRHERALRVRQPLPGIGLGASLAGVGLVSSTKSSN